jgi:transposase
MKNVVELRYSQAFKLQVVDEIEKGVFGCCKAASRHYGIAGATTVRGWVRQWGKNHLLRKVVRVEAVGESDRIAQLQKQLEKLERALGQSAAERLLAEEYLKLACGQLGQEVEAFKKKSDGQR